MFRELRRKDKELSIEEVKCLLIEQRRGILAVNGDDNYPYAIPINYLYDEEENKIYFHGLSVGHKADSILKSDKVCFTVYGKEIIKEEIWAPYLKSVVVFGRCHKINDRDSVIELTRKFANKYYPDSKLVDIEIEKSGKAVCIYEIEIEHLSGKEIQEK